MKALKKWIGVEIESDSAFTDQLKSFASDFKKDFVAQLKKNSDIQLKDFSVGHFYISGFIYNKATEKFAYYSTLDVRYGANWADEILFRSADNTKDFTGGQNNFCSFDELGANLIAVTLR